MIEVNARRIRRYRLWLRANHHPAPLFVIALIIATFAIRALPNQTIQNLLGGGLNGMLIVMAMPAFRHIWRLRRRSIRTAYASDGKCPTCQYDRRLITSGRCPECGMTVARQTKIPRW